MASVPNWKLVPPQNRHKLRHILKWARKQPHPFTQCKIALTKRGVPPERANRICAVMKDMALRRTTWREGGKG